MAGFLGSLLVAVVCGLITKSINQSKGYDGGFAWGFFLLIIGIIVVAVRPYNPSYSTSTYDEHPGYTEEKKEERVAEKYSDDQNIYYCKKCRRIVIDKRAIYFNCTKCNEPLKNSWLSKTQWDNMSIKEKNEYKAKWFDLDLHELFDRRFREVFRENGFESYIPFFEKHKLIDENLVYSLTENDLKEIGIESLGDRKRIIDAIKKISIYENPKDDQPTNPDEPREDDWICPKCGVRNRSYVVSCINCLTRRPGVK